ncbi:hypothetical protein FD754_003515 [Muntiacus muntjak]|uniref:Transcriptional repressor RHIT n=1 Tax=Muntiacus muntjak TaxID=9888 RepID=A0A5N3WCB8_MUNMU|nr:hypothetical protein FD754_003515 [Muntiacus muntjak]
MSADDRGIRATQDKERARETPGHGHSCQEMLSESEGTVPVGEAHIKMEPEEPHPEEVSREARAQGARGLVPLSQGAQEKLCFLPGGALPAPQIPVLSREGETRDRQMAAALLTAWSQMPQSSYREVLQKRNLSGPLKGEAPGSSRHAGHEEKEKRILQKQSGKSPGDAPRCGQQAASGQNSGPAKDDVQPSPPDTDLLKTQEGHFPEQPREGGITTPESGEEGLALDSEAGKNTYKCEQCGKAFSWPSHLVTHRRTHLGEKPYACPSCWKSFSHHSTPIQHQRIHTGEKPYAKRFTRRSDLVTHQGTHTGAKPHKCLICGKCFTQSSALVTHQRTHTGVKLYPCPECCKCFSQRSNLIAHSHTHTGEKPYHCLNCGKSFSHSSHLTAHQRTTAASGPTPARCVARASAGIPTCTGTRRSTRRGARPWPC